MRCAALLLPLASSAVEPPVTLADQAELVQGNNAFAVELYQQLKNDPGNLFFSPESISIALAMTYAGARGDTAAEMAKTLHFTLPPERLHLGMAGLLNDRNAAHDGYQIKEADALWGQKGYVFLDNFLKLTNDDYGARFNQVDFKTDAEGARNTINRWVAQQTENRIKDLIGQRSLDGRTRLVLTNAIYFKGDWQAQFKKEDTMEGDFHVSSTQTVQAPMMRRTGEFKYRGSGAFQLLELPYKNKELSMIVFLPWDANGLAGLEQRLTAASMKQWLEHFGGDSEVIVIMPKFRMESRFALKERLAMMGMKQAFEPAEANFSGMALEESMQKTGKVSISDIIHSACIDVNEEGTEASASTGVLATYTPMGQIGAPQTPVFRADHPFLFLIRDNKSGAILFMGRVINPRA
jgi:serpin B